MSEIGALPVFPLATVVLFPGASLPLHVFEPRYRTMLKDCLAAGGAMIIAQEAEDGVVAGLGLVVEHQPLPDGRSNILVAGKERVRLDAVQVEDASHPYRRARVEILRPLEVEVPEAEKTALIAAATMFAAAVKRHDASFAFRVPPTLSPGELADRFAHQLVIDPAIRQAALEDLDPRSRVDLVTRQLALQHEALVRDAPGKVLH